MRKKEQDVLETSEELVTLAGDLRHKLQELGFDLSKKKALDRLPVDMADIYFICVNYQRLVDSFLALRDEANPQNVLKIIIEIEQHFYDHLSYHYKPLSKGLKELIKLVEPDKKKREKFFERYFYEVTEKARRNSSQD